MKPKPCQTSWRAIPLPYFISSRIIFSISGCFFSALFLTSPFFMPGFAIPVGMASSGFMGLSYPVSGFALWDVLLSGLTLSSADAP